MKPNSEEDELDALLAQPSQISDRGFCRETLELIDKSESRRTKIFTVAAIIWLVLALAISSPAELMQQIRRYGEGFLSFLSGSLRLTDIDQANILGSSQELTLPILVLLLAAVIFSNMFSRD